MTEVISKRHPREYFTKVLIRIFERLTEKFSAVVKYRDRYTGKQQEEHISVDKVWVVGSYARGSLTCGDLDILVKVRTCQDVQNYEIRQPDSPRATAKVFFNSPADVRFYWGNPEDNTSGVKFEEAKLIWDGVTCDWRSAIDGIQIDENAGHYERLTDAIPFRMEQLATYKEIIEEIVEAKNQGVVEWTFIPFSEERIAQPDPSRDLPFYKCFIKEQSGKETVRLFPFIYSVLQQEPIDPCSKWYFGIGKNDFVFGSNVLCLGRPDVSIKYLDEIVYSEIIVIPHLSRRGPNGAWKLRRGVAHPLYKKFMVLNLFYIEGKDGFPRKKISRSKTSANKRKLCLFANRKLAEMCLLAKAGTPDFNCIKKMDADLLLKQMAVVDAIELVSEHGRKIKKIDKETTVDQWVEFLSS